MSIFKPTLALTLGALSGLAHAEVFNFKDWAVACDNTRHCEAVAYQSEESDSAPVVLWLSRDAGPNAPVRVQVDVDEREDLPPLTMRLGSSTLKGISTQKT